MLKSAGLSSVAAVATFLFVLISCTQRQIDADETMVKIRTISDEQAMKDAKEIRESVAVELEEGLELSLWASDSLVNAPIAISIDPNGKVYYTKAVRPLHSEFDIRGHRNWMTASISFETVEDRRKFLRETFAEGTEESEKHLVDLNNDGIKDWRDLTVEKDEVWWVQDVNGDGVAERSQLFIKDFHEEITDVANGVEALGDEVYVSIAPDVWRIKDTDQDGFADEKESISHGYAVHIGFGGHGMSGVIKGPDGRMYWGIGDIGMNVVDKEGKKWEYPNQGVIVRSEPDGSNFEVFAAGLRNTHEFVFDKYGNIITEDNDGDHPGERERLMYVVNGSDAGWRTNWQFGKYTDPDNNSYKVWMDEGLSIPKWDNQAAYIVPPIQNYVNGPTGMVYNPGTALGKEWYDHFFIAEFRGSPANSPVHAFTLKPQGAGYALEESRAIVSGLLPTGMDFGPDGALYFSDWIDGWSPQQKGRIWKVDVKGGDADPIRAETRRLISEDFSAASLEQLDTYLDHQDMRIRSKAQFELVKRGAQGYEVFQKALDQNNSQLKRIHGIWGIAQMARLELNLASPIAGLLSDQDAEIRAQAAKWLGDIRYSNAAETIVPLLTDASLRVQMFAAEALGRMAFEGARQGLIDLLIRNDNRDVYLRHAASLALSRIGDAEILVEQEHHPSKALRLGCVVALRRMQHPGAAVFLDDKDEWVAAEAARAINDDRSIVEALPDLARALNTTIVRNEVFLRRAINANYRLGGQENIDQLIQFIKNPQAPDAMRAEALACLGTWANPSPLDRVTGRNRNLKPRDGTYARAALAEIVDEMAEDAPAGLSIAIVRAISKLDLKEKVGLVEQIFKVNIKPEVKEEALKALAVMQSENLAASLEEALSGSDAELRSAALALIPDSPIDETRAVDLFKKIINDGTTKEKQTALAALSGYKGDDAASLLSEYVTRLEQGKVAAEIALDILESASAHGSEILKAQVSNYYASKGESDLAAFEECLTGGDERRGRNIFFRNEAAQCVRCHSIYEWGGDAGPGLQGIASKLTERELLEAMVLPSKRLAPGFGVLSVELQDGVSVVGVLERESETELVLKVSKDENKVINKSDVVSQSFIPSSMPDMSAILTKMEIRDVVSFLSGLKLEEEIQ